MDVDLLALWTKKKTGSQVATILGKKYGHVFSRSSIMGRVGRLDLQRKGGNNKLPNHFGTVAKHPNKARADVGNKSIPGRRLKRGVKGVMPQIIIPHIESNKGCTYIYGDARGRNFCPNRAVFNRRSTSGAVSWCAEHVAIVYQPEKALSKSRVASLSIPSQRGRQVAR